MSKLVNNKSEEEISLKKIMKDNNLNKVIMVDKNAVPKDNEIQENTLYLVCEEWLYDKAR